MEKRIDRTTPHTGFPWKSTGKGQKGTPAALVAKRSYQRALRRASIYGWTSYRGQILHADLGGSKPMPAPSTKRQMAIGQCRPGKRAAVMSWNVGGLTSEINQELLQWIAQTQVDIILLQGTRWREDRTWSSHDYSFVQCGEPAETKNTHAGLLIGISRRLCTAEDISFATILPGRLQHVKCRIGEKFLDIVNVYQHTDHANPTRPHPMTSREEVWTHVDHVLHTIAHRNVLVLGGDFNCSLPLQSSMTTGQYPDAAEFSGLIRKYHLHTVRTHDKGPTFKGPQGQSTIDYIFLRQVQMDSYAHQGSCIRDFPLASWRGFQDHLPVLCSVSLGWNCWFAKRPKTKKLPKSTLDAMHQAWTDVTPAWTQLTAELSTALQALPANMEALSQFTDHAIDRCAQVFKRVHVKSQPGRECSKTSNFSGNLGPQSRNSPENWTAWQTDDSVTKNGNPPSVTHPPMQLPHRSVVAQMWSHFRALRRTWQTTQFSMFQAWHHFAQISKSKRELSKACKRLKQQRLFDAVALAQDAADRHDTRKLFCIIRSIAPKMPFKLIRLRGQHGEALTATAECDLLEAHFRSVFQSPDCPADVYMQPLQGMPFTQSDLEAGLMKAAVTKAVAPGTLPNVLLRALAENLSQWLWPMLEELWMSSIPTIPQCWRDAWLCLLAKRNVKKPTDTRPIALTDGIGKVVLGILTKVLKQHLMPSLCRLPIYAFIPNRGTEEALIVVTNHCRHVRSQCEAQIGSFWSKMAGNRPAPLAGGALLSLDMSQAFDRLPRTYLAQGFADCQVPPDLAQMFLGWLHNATYHIDHRGVKASIATSRGVRQGCKASPIEWTIFLVSLMKKLDATMPCSVWTSWIRNHLVTYADDLIAMWSFAYKQDISDMLVQVGHLLDTLEEVGMIVNLDKTAFLLRISGKHAKALRKTLIYKGNSKQWIRIPRKHGPDTYIPLVNNHTYLGAKIGFYAFEEQTLKYRLQIGKTAFLRLRPWLLKRHTYPLPLRVQLWLTCIRSSYLHGLQAVGLSSKGAQQLQRRFLTEHRQIARSPSHITHESSTDLCARLGIALPLQGLATLWTQQYVNKCSKWEGLASDDVLHDIDIHQHHNRVMQAFDQALPPAALSDVQLCPYCDFSTQFQTQLTKHLHKRHMIAPQHPSFCALCDMLSGRPQCAHCRKIFSSFAGLKAHIAQASCPEFDPQLDWQVPLADHPVLRSMALSGHWTNLWADDDLLSQLRTCCVICNQQAITPKGLSEHLHRSHPAAWESAQVYLAPLIALSVGQPCRACGQKGLRSHACPVLRQLALIKSLQVKGVSAATLLVAADTPTSDLPLCSPMKKHKTQDSRVPKKPVINEFHPARDSLDGLPQCAHCGKAMYHHPALQKHIEGDNCADFDPARPVGQHVPCTWRWIRDLAVPDLPKGLLFHHDALQVLKNTCVLCGHKVGHSKHVLAHLQLDHAPIYDVALTEQAPLLQKLQDLTPCSCDILRPPHDHQCCVHVQTVILQYIVRHDLVTCCTGPQTFFGCLGRQDASCQAYWPMQCLWSWMWQYEHVRSPCLAPTIQWPTYSPLHRDIQDRNDEGASTTLDKSTSTWIR